MAESFAKGRGRFTMPETATYAASVEGKQYYFTVFPDQDLFIIQQPDIRTIHWGLVWHSIPSFGFMNEKWVQLRRGSRHT